MSIKILFVDDDENILRGIERIMKTERPGVEFSLSSGADEALRLLEHDVFDAVIADYRMPGKDGIELLTEVKKRFPAIIRVLLTGQSESELKERASSIADRFYTKPCDSIMIVSEIEKSTGK
jgi:DNA-binding NtrC family response regulator